jgi:hypothetical protein
LRPKIIIIDDLIPKKEILYTIVARARDEFSFPSNCGPSIRGSIMPAINTRPIEKILEEKTLKILFMKVWFFKIDQRLIS